MGVPEGSTAVVGVAVVLLLMETTPVPVVMALMES
jgi:hypothetical protein